MIIYDIANHILVKVTSIRHFENRDPKFVVYIDNRTYCDMMGESTDQVREMAMEISNKKTIYGFPIYRVNEQDHGWKIYEVTT